MLGLISAPKTTTFATNGKFAGARHLACPCRITPLFKVALHLCLGTG